MVADLGYFTGTGDGMELTDRYGLKPTSYWTINRTACDNAIPDALLGLTTTICAEIEVAAANENGSDTMGAAG